MRNLGQGRYGVGAEESEGELERRYAGIGRRERATSNQGMGNRGQEEKHKLSPT